MNDSSKAHDEQATLWNSAAGCSWVEAQAALDQMFKPVEDLLVEAAAARRTKSVLDVGCGTGGTTVALARQLGAEGRCVGIDISEPMTAAARRRAEQSGVAASFIHADAETHDFEPEGFDLIVSRFGVMFFKDSVRAFSNLRRAARTGAELCAIVWRSPLENPFMTTAERAATAVLSNIPARQSDAPGQFGFADPNRVRAVLEASGWEAIDIRPVDVKCEFAERDLERYVTRLGPVGRILEQEDDATRSRVLETILPAFEPYVRGDTVRFDAACWRIAAARSIRS